MNERRVINWLMLVMMSVVITHTTHTTTNAQTSCFTPGTEVVTDPNEEIIQQLDIRSVSIAEPYYSDGIGRLAVTVKTQNLYPMVLASWNVFIDTPDGQHRFLQMSNLLGTPQARYGTVTFLLGLPIFNYQGSVQNSYQNDGTIRFVIEKSKLGEPATGQTIGVAARTYLKPVLDLLQVDSTATNNYALVGNAACAPFRIAQFGQNADIPVAADYNRNGTTDFAVWRPATGGWYTVDSVTGEFTGKNWGSGDLGDIPVAGDFDTDGRADWTVYRPGTGTWYIYGRAGDTTQVTQFGGPSDIPLAGDFDGDGISDITVWRPATGVWYTLLSVDGSVKITAFGQPEDVPVIGDYDGDRKADVAIWRPSTGSWYVTRSSDGAFQGMQFGIGTDRVAQADYDGDGKTDYAVFRPESAYWYVLRSSSGVMSAAQWGASEDKIQPGDYNGNGRADYAVWRPSNGVWYVNLN
jgi:hypothetical protein